MEQDDAVQRHSLSEYTGAEVLLLQNRIILIAKISSPLLRNIYLQKGRGQYSLQKASKVISYAIYEFYCFDLLCGQQSFKVRLLVKFHDDYKALPTFV